MGSKTGSQGDAQKLYRTIAAQTPEPGMVERAKALTRFYYNGIRQIFRNRSEAKRLTARGRAGEVLTRREILLIRKSREDIGRVAPFALVAIILPELLIVLIVLAPGMFPSTCITDAQIIKKHRKAQETRQSIHDSVVTAATENSGLTVKNFLNIQSIIKVADQYQTDLAVAGLPKEGLRNICRFVGLGSLGTEGMLRKKVEQHLMFLHEDDKMIRKEGIESLTLTELQEACELRGISTHDRQADHLQGLLRDSIRLNLMMDPRPLPPLLTITARMFLLNTRLAH
ncbi:hypothetical protein IWQ60_011050 [Tieghemiomyces parasiticus]|uniref:Letm1 RBD domain-containing protein n=1 Tax=Tieghemiomyces parasiticus TaxID=78921 RepID=A0A9W7ZJI0_9FUNG|nr:hypothetical protein IWQ60_011050 [Tieghemiomyces parasiticus]